MHYVLYCLDKSGHSQIRADNRNAHLDYLKTFGNAEERLCRRGVRLLPNRSGGYDVVSLSLPLDTQGTPLAVGEEGAGGVD